jgi:hypothetical protein
MSFGGAKTKNWLQECLPVTLPGSDYATWQREVCYARAMSGFIAELSKAA